MGNRTALFANITNNAKDAKVPNDDLQKSESHTCGVYDVTFNACREDMIMTSSIFDKNPLFRGCIYLGLLANAG